MRTEPGQQLGIANANLEFADLHRSADDLARYREALDTIRSWAEQAGESGWLSLVDFHMAWLALAEGEPTQAVRLAEQCLTSDQEAARDVTWSTARLARALAADGREEDAGREIRAAEAAVAETQDVFFRLGIALELALAEKSLRRADAARRRLQEHLEVPVRGTY